MKQELKYRTKYFISSNENEELIRVIRHNWKASHIIGPKFFRNGLESLQKLSNLSRSGTCVNVNFDTNLNQPQQQPLSPPASEMSSPPSYHEVMGTTLSSTSISGSTKPTSTPPNPKFIPNPLIHTQSSIYKLYKRKPPSSSKSSKLSKSSKSKSQPQFPHFKLCGPFLASQNSCDALIYNAVIISHDDVVLGSGAKRGLEMKEERKGVGRVGIGRMKRKGKLSFDEVVEVYERMRKCVQEWEGQSRDEGEREREEDDSVSDSDCGGYESSDEDDDDEDTDDGDCESQFGGGHDDNLVLDGYDFEDVKGELNEPTGKEQGEGVEDVIDLLSVEENVFDHDRAGPVKRERIVKVENDQSNGVVEDVIDLLSDEENVVPEKVVMEDVIDLLSDEENVMNDDDVEAEDGDVFLTSHSSGNVMAASQVKQEEGGCLRCLRNSRKRVAEDVCEGHSGEVARVKMEHREVVGSRVKYENIER
ncbi:hypothetical protein HDU76_003002 [Blyttiomyces sp. JEL0837]|nr:hypothetical protein HDU76_003002 [Blyttiomyces sp. JEL0837]